MISAFRMSMLVEQRRLLRGVFDERHPCPWLVWERATVEPSRDAPQSLVRTASPESDFLVPASADPVCFDLRGDLIHVGRTPENDLVVLDATISRRHLVLQRVGGDYTAVALPGAKSVHVRETLLATDTGHPLKSGDPMRLGGTRFVYLGPKELIARLSRSL